MRRYHRGDVVLVRYPYEEDSTKDKLRPGIVIAEPSLTGDGLYCICKISHMKPNLAYHPHYIEVKLSSVEGMEMGIIRDSYIHLDVNMLVADYLIYRRIGFYYGAEEIYSKYYLPRYV